MDDIAVITARVDEHGALVDVDIEGRPKAELTETKQSQPTPSFGDVENKDRAPLARRRIADPSSISRPACRPVPCPAT